MHTTLIIGGSGKVARHLTRILTTETSPPHTVHSLIRNPSQTPSLTALGAIPILQSIEEATVSSLVATLTAIQPGVVIWCAGAGSGDENYHSRLAAVDRDGAIKVMDACAEAGIKRFITISAMDVRDHSLPTPSWYDEGTKERAAKVYAAVRPFMDAKFAADKELVTGNEKRGLEYTIVRAAGLGSLPGTGRVAAGRVQLAKVVKREDLARVVVGCIVEVGTVGLVFDVAAGEATIEEEVLRVARERIDVFEGFY